MRKHLDGISPIDSVNELTLDPGSPPLGRYRRRADFGRLYAAHVRPSGNWRALKLALASRQKLELGSGQLTCQPPVRFLPRGLLPAQNKFIKSQTVRRARVGLSTRLVLIGAR